jgi:hypothetical protein
VNREQERQHNDYFVAVRAEDAALEPELGGIRSREDAGKLTIRQAADLRVAALTGHPGTVPAAPPRPARRPAVSRDAAARLARLKVVYGDHWRF